MASFPSARVFLAFPLDVASDKILKTECLSESLATQRTLTKSTYKRACLKFQDLTLLASARKSSPFSKRCSATRSRKSSSLKRKRVDEVLMKKLKISKCALNGDCNFHCQSPCAVLRTACHLQNILKFSLQKFLRKPTMYYMHYI
jgi:hypothetical protein